MNWRKKDNIHSLYVQKVNVLYIYIPEGRYQHGHLMDGAKEILTVTLLLLKLLIKAKKKTYKTSKFLDTIEQFP